LKWLYRPFHTWFFPFNLISSSCDFRSFLNKSTSILYLTTKKNSRTKTAGQIHVGGIIWSLFGPNVHSGFNCDAHLLCNVIWHHRQWSPVIPLYVFIDFLHRSHLKKKYSKKKTKFLLIFFCYYFPAQLPSIQWCNIIVSGFRALAYVEIQFGGARLAHRSWTTYRQNVQHKPCLPKPTRIVKQRLQ
jgi:hypothetical protein